jgi:LPS sulfotransferase NodH
MGKIFVVAGSHRSGTNLLCNAIGTLEGVQHFGEPFQIYNTPESIDRWRKPILKEVFRAEMFLHYVERAFKWSPFTITSKDSGLFFNGLLEYFANHEENIIVKVLFQQCPYYYDVWDVILRDPRCKIIYINRQLLDISVSHQHASRTKQWYIPTHTDTQPEVPEKIRITPRRYLDFASFLNSQYTYFDVLAHKEPSHVYKVQYEELVKDWTYVTLELMRWLGIKGHTIEPVSKRQITKDHKELIENLDELRRYFKNTSLETDFT